MIVMLSGWMGSGKDTVGNYLCNTFGMKRLAFADALKTKLSTEYNIPIEWMYSEQGKATFVDRYQKTVRQLLIDFGMGERAKDPCVWIKAVIAQVGNDNVVITDWRLENEFTEMVNAFGKQNVLTVRINRFDKCPYQDMTETTLDTFPFDMVIDNKGNLDELYAELFKNFSSVVAP